MEPLFCRHIGNHLAVCSIHAGAADVADEVGVGVDDGKHKGVGLVELLHHLLHGVVDSQGGGRRRHQLLDGEMVIEFGAEHHVANSVEVHLTEEGARLVEDGEESCGAHADDIDQLAQRHIGGDGGELPVDDAVEAHEGEHRLVGMVGDELALACQAHAVDAVGLEDVDGEVGADADNHQGDEHLVATRDFGDEEDAGERCVHHARHHTRHAQQCEVLLGQVDADAVDIPQVGEEETGESSDEQRGSERTATAATAVGGRCGEHLRGEDESDIHHEEVAMSIEERVVEYRVPVGFCPAVEQDVDAGVALAIE